MRDSAALLDATAGPRPATPTRRRRRRARSPPRSEPTPAGCASPTPPGPPGGDLGHPDCVAALDDAVALCAALGHEMVEADLPGLDPPVGAAIGTVFNAATAWIVAYWIRASGASPGPTSSSRSPAPTGRRASRSAPPTTCSPSRTLQRFAARVARVPRRGVDAVAHPDDVGAAGAARRDHLDAGRAAAGARAGRPTVAYAGVVANITGNPAMSVPLWWNADGLPIGVHVLGRFGDEATLFRLAAQLEAARPWAGRARRPRRQPAPV